MIKTCPLCKTPLRQTVLAENLPAYSCPTCEGIWISADEFLVWRAPHPFVLPEALDIEQAFDLPYPIADNKQALFCPDCGRFLRRFEIWPNVAFHLDRCSTCTGIWFDQNEWHTLQVQNLHYHLNLFFSPVWQAKLKEEEMRQRFVKMYLETFGEADYEKIKVLRAWLAEHPQGNRLMAYLTDRDPYKG